mmetsp:Transcript_30414/g.106821  ORF Transcript_30414/g.106821 Transcript_30414/m.106821 type:complete len:268 (+) Transcript_30414:263-1066(+)
MRHGACVRLEAKEVPRLHGHAELQRTGVDELRGQSVKLACEVRLHAPDGAAAVAGADEHEGADPGVFFEHGDLKVVALAHVARQARLGEAGLHRRRPLARRRRQALWILRRRAVRRRLAEFGHREVDEHHRVVGEPLCLEEVAEHAVLQKDEVATPVLRCGGNDGIESVVARADVNWALGRRVCGPARARHHGVVRSERRQKCPDAARADDDGRRVKRGAARRRLQRGQLVRRRDALGRPRRGQAARQNRHAHRQQQRERAHAPTAR